MDYFLWPCIGVVVCRLRGEAGGRYLHASLVASSFRVWCGTDGDSQPGPPVVLRNAKLTRVSLPHLVNTDVSQPCILVQMRVLF